MLDNANDNKLYLFSWGDRNVVIIARTMEEAQEIFERDYLPQGGVFAQRVSADYLLKYCGR